MNRTDAVMKGCIVADKNCSLAKRCPECLKEIKDLIAIDNMFKTIFERSHQQLKDLENKKKETK